MAAGHRKTGRKFLELCNLKIETKPSMIEKSIISLKAAIQSGGEVGGEAETNRCIACIMKEIQTTGQEIVQFSWNPRKDDPETKPASEPTSNQRSQPHISLVTIIAIIIIYHPLYQHSHPHQEYPPNYHRYPPSYY
jgi:hypothetical protein